MLTTLLMLAAIPGAPLEVRPRIEGHAALELVVRAEESRLRFFNPTDAPELVMLHDRATQRHASLVVPPMAELEFRYFARAFEGLDVRVLARSSDGLYASAWFACEALHVSGAEQLTWFVACAGHVHAWKRAHDAWLPLEPENGANGCGAPHPLTSPVRPCHVPVITPNEGQHGDLPPRLERPLPPV